MKSALPFAALLALAAVPAHADGYEPRAHAPMLHAPHHHQAWRHHRHHRVAVLPGVLGMERGGVLYWRPAVEPMPEFIFDVAEPYHRHHRHYGSVVSARY